MEDIQREASSKYPNQSDPPRLAPFKVKEQQFYSKFPLDVQTESGYPTEEISFGCLYVQSHCLAH